MKLKQISQLAIQKLQKNKIGSPALDAEVLLAHVLRTTREKLYTHPEQKLTSSQLIAYSKLIGRRAKHEPVAYLTGHKKFFGLDFLVNKKVLIPRPETELMVEETKKLLTTHYKLPTNLIDIGTGSGCIIITLSKLLTTHYKLQTKFYATDISRAALKLAHCNAHHHGVEKQIKFFQGNLLEPVFNKIPLFPPLTKGDVRGISEKNYQLIITANLPYLPTAEWRQTPLDVKNYEPRLALDGGPDGLKYYRQLFFQLKKLQTTHYKLPTTNLLCEICPHQANAITKLVRKYFPIPKCQIKKDLCGHKRLAIITIK